MKMKRCMVGVIVLFSLAGCEEIGDRTCVVTLADGTEESVTGKGLGASVEIFGDGVHISSFNNRVSRVYPAGSYTAVRCK